MPLNATRPVPEEAPVMFLIVDFSDESMMRKCFDGTLFGEWTLITEKLKESRLKWRPSSDDKITEEILEQGDLIVLRGNPTKGISVTFRKKPPVDGTLVTLQSWDRIRESSDAC